MGDTMVARRYSALLLVAGILFVTGAAVAESTPATAPSVIPATQPSPALAPQDVVRAQMDALQHNDVGGPDSGIAIVFSFASPQNQKHTGPLDRFARMIKSPAYNPMLNCKTVEYGPIHVTGRMAQQGVKLIDANGQSAIYVFFLSRQIDGPLKDCWMTEGVVRMQIPPAPDVGVQKT